MKQIDYDLIKEFPKLGLYQSKAAIADYADSEFGLKIPRNLAYENMVKKLEEHVGTPKVKEPKFVLDASGSDQSKELDDAISASVSEVTESTNKTLTMVEKITSPDFIDSAKIETMAKNVVKSNDRKATLMDLLPPDFKPCFVPMGEIDSFYPLSYWIHDWIQETSDWEFKINEYPRIQEHKFLYTLVYYIAKYGKFTIRETRNSQFITLS